MRIGSLDAQKGSQGTVRDVVVSYGTGFDFDVAFSTEEEEDIDGAEGYIIALGRDV